MATSTLAAIAVSDHDCPEMHLFSGEAYEPVRDQARLMRQIDCILAVTLGAGWLAVPRIVQLLRKRYPHIGFPENSVQAQLRNLRKVGYRVERRHVANGLFQYRVLAPVNPGVGVAARKAEVKA